MTVNEVGDSSVREAIDAAAQDAGARLEVRRVTPTIIECVVTGASSDWDGRVDIWVGEERLSPETVDCERISGRSAAVLAVRPIGRSPLAWLDGRARLGLEGTGAAPLPPPDLSLTQAEVGVRLNVGPALILPDGFVLRLHMADGAAEPLFADAVVRNGAALFAAPADLDPAALTFAITTSDGITLATGLRLASETAQRLTRNGAFAAWDEAGPIGWRTLAPDARRAAYAFPAEDQRRLGLSGATFACRVDEGAFVTLLEQDLDPVAPGGAVDLGLYARAATLTEIEIEILNGEAKVAQARFIVERSWAHRRQIVSLPEDQGALRLRIAARVLTGGPGGLEIGGVRLGVGAEAFDDLAAADDPGADLLVNGDLQHWPNGVAGQGPGPWTETADGWSVFNAPARFAAVVEPASDRGLPVFGLSLAALSVAEGCRIEVRLKPKQLAGTLALSFEARVGEIGESPGAALLVDRQSLYVDAINLFRRDMRRIGQVIETFEVPVATLAKRVLLTRQWGAFVFACEIEHDAPVRDEDSLGTEYFLGVEIHRPFALQIRKANLRAVAERPAAPAPLLEIEDTKVRAQVGLIAGLDAWLSPTPLRAEPWTSQPAQAAAEVARWNWNGPPVSVEVAICVHNATEDVLACLASLTAHTSIPHTVRVLDDGSDEDCHQRIAAYVADKPWFRLERNAGNIGYTATANRAVRQSAADWVVLLNSDTLVTDGWLEGLLEVAASDPQAALVGPVSNAATYQSVPELYDGAGKWLVNTLPPGWSVADMARAVARAADRAFPQTPLLNGFCTLINRRAFEAIGGLDEAAFPQGYGEENDLCLRATKAGYHLRVADHVYVHHAKSASFGSARRAELSAAGDQALRGLHPEVDVRALTRRFMETPALARLREALRQAVRSSPHGEGAA